MSFLYQKIYKTVFFVKFVNILQSFPTKANMISTFVVEFVFALSYVNIKITYLSYSSSDAELK
jgi:hypothetical protein